jgi:hypothetical protein
VKRRSASLAEQKMCSRQAAKVSQKDNSATILSTVEDAFENRVFAIFLWINGNVDKCKTVPPDKVAASSSKDFCHSQKESRETEHSSRTVPRWITSCTDMLK